VDLSAAPDDGDLARLAPVAHKAVVALNKSDLPPALSEAAFTARFPKTALIRCSALTGDGLPALRAAVQSVLNADRACAFDDLVVTSARHHALLREAETALNRACAELDAGATIDLAADDLRDAMDALGQITGRAVTDDVLAEIFSKFCIGK
jgi:tRNA modification GTPase